jgi:hypothetical protein
LPINLPSLCVKLIGYPPITFLPGFRNILPQCINKMLGGWFTEFDEAKPLQKVADVVGRDTG